MIYHNNNLNSVHIFFNFKQHREQETYTQSLVYS